VSEATYSTKNLTGKYFKLNGFFFFFIPVGVPYAKLEQEAKAAGFTPDLSFGCLEMGVKLGMGWVALKVNDDADENHPNIITLEGEFTTYEHQGPYRQMGTSYQKVMQDHPSAQEFYNLYLNSPYEVAPDELRTLICFR
jgi:hypothetical protein